MPTYLHPGVYIEEVAAGARPIEAVGTSTAAFVGIAEKGPVNEAKFITNFTEFQQIYGGYVREKSTIGTSYLAYSVFQFFQNGGAACYVVRVEYGARTAELKLYTNEGNHTMTIEAISPGAWGNDLRIAVGAGTTSDEGFNLYVFLADELVETYEDLSMINTSPFYVDRVTKRSIFIRTKSRDLPDNPTLIGKKEIPDLTGVNLQKVKNIRLKIDKYGPYTIDCSVGTSDVTAVKAENIQDNINKAFQEDIKVPVASVEDNRIKITSPTTETDSEIVLTAPGSMDATYDILGLQESSWVLKGTNQKLAQALGLDKPDTTSLLRNMALNIALETVPEKSINITQRDNVYDIVSIINAQLQRNIAYTDGCHLVLSTNEDIYIKRPDDDRIEDIENIFGQKFYSYVHRGSGDQAAKIEGEVEIKTGGPFSGQLRLKIDDNPSFVVKFAIENTSTAQTVANAINTAFQKASKSRKTVAQATNDDRVVLRSINTGETGRIIISSHTGVDAAASVFGTAYTNKNDYFIPAETQSVAQLVGETNFSPPQDIGRDLAAPLPDPLIFRMSAASDPVQFGHSLAANATIRQLFEIFGDQADLNHKLLLQVTSTSEEKVHMIAASLSEVPELHFSIPLDPGAETDPHGETVAGKTHAAYIRLFGLISPFKGDPQKMPHYTYRFGLPDNNPITTVIVSGEELDFSRSPSLGGGDQDRTDPNMLRDLTVGSVSGQTSGLRLLDNHSDISILVIPGWSEMDKDIATSFIDKGTAYCDKVRPSQARPLRDLFFVTNTPSSETSPIDARTYVKEKINYRSSGGYVSIYYPWITVNDPIGTDSPTIFIPPAGSIAGLYSSMDARRGVWKAPAGTEAGVAGVVGLADQVSDIKQDLLNTHGINAIRRIPGAGIVSWGGRTLATNPEWKYVSVRRTAIMIEVSIYNGIQWAVFEPNDENLWSLLRLNINAFMMTLFRNGAFQGSTPGEAFLVRCDSETTTQNDIDLGRVNILVGFAPLKPAEFVIVKISQKAGQKE